MKFDSAIFAVSVVVCFGRVSGQSKKSSEPTVRNDESGLKVRSRDLLDKALQYNNLQTSFVTNVVDQLVRIYEHDINPLEQAYRYNAFPGKGEMTAGEIKANPMALFLGPWSTGKTTMISYILDTDVLRISAEPTTSEFTVLSYGPEVRNTGGDVLASEKSEYAPLGRFGQGFLARFSGVELPHPLLKRITFVDTPGIIENRKQQERGYPFNKVMQWFIDKADLVFVMFDPAKLDIGHELETIFKQLKGKESKIRLVLNKADTNRPQELMRIYGALFWSLQPLVNVTEPPRVYVGSFWKYEYKPNTHTALFKQEEVSLLQDLTDVINNRLENKVVFVRRHAQRVRIHALLVNEYVTAFRSRYVFPKFLKDPNQIIEQLKKFPDSYGIFKNAQTKKTVSQYDMPPASLYEEFFNQNPLQDFKPLEEYYGFFTGCEIDKLETAISMMLPKLLAKVVDQKSDYSIKTEL